MSLARDLLARDAATLMPPSVAYLRALAESQFVSDLLGGHLLFEWATVSMVSDDPAKGHEIVHNQEPGTRFWLRIAVRMISVLPIEWLL